MASGVLQNVSNQPGATTESKNKKKKGVAKNLEAPPASASKDSSALNSPRNGPDDTGEASGEKEHVREVLKQIRNVNKKLNSMQKVDSIIKENPGVSLEDLVTSRKINADQRAQALKKPQLQSQLASLEEQLAVYRKIESDYQNQIAKEKDSQLSSHVQELDKIREETRAEAAQEADRDFKNKILTFSRFLAAAANRRNQGDDSSPEGRAFEGALLLVYGGDVNAVEAAEKIVSGSTDSVIGVDGISTNTSFQRVRELTLQEIPLTTEIPWDSHHQASTTVGSDPTVANAGLTELEDPTTAELINGASKIALNEAGSSAPKVASIDAGAANAVAESHWDSAKPSTQDDPLSESFEIVPRDTEDSQSSTPIVYEAAPVKQSWSDVPGGNSFADIPSIGSSTSNGMAESLGANDGFHEVKHHHGSRGRSHSGGTQRGDRSRGGQQGGHRRGGGGFRGGDRGGQRGSGRGGHRPRGRGD